MREEREDKLRSVIRQSQSDLCVVLENIFDPHNISAIVRTCDAVGIREVFAYYSEEYLDKRGLQIGKKTSAGAFKWMDVYLFDDMDECFERVRKRYKRILSTHLGSESKSLYDLDLCQPTALLFGNEDEGISEEALAKSDGNFVIPQMGFVESLNISVAVAVSLYEASRQRSEKGMYDENPVLDDAQQDLLFQRWSEMLNKPSWHRQFAIPVSKESPELLPIYVERKEHKPRKRRGRKRPGQRIQRN